MHLDVWGSLLPVEIRNGAARTIRQHTVAYEDGYAARVVGTLRSHLKHAEMGYGDTSSSRLLRVATPNCARIAATMRKAAMITKMTIGPVVRPIDDSIEGISGAMTRMPTPPPRWPTPSTSAKPVARARVG